MNENDIDTFKGSLINVLEEQGVPPTLPDKRQYLWRLNTSVDLLDGSCTIMNFCVEFHDRNFLIEISELSVLRFFNNLNVR